MLVAILGPVALYLVDRRWLGGVLFGGIHALDRQALVALQVWRVGGLFFLVEWARGHLPGGFALPAGIGDILVGVTAPLVVALLARHRGVRAFAWWNGLGLLDLVVAVGAGVLHASGPLGLLAGAVPSDMVARYPLSLVPTFLVPLAVILHLEGALQARRLAGVGTGRAPEGKTSTSPWGSPQGDRSSKDLRRRYCLTAV
jgi:hypothetical protein